MNTLYVIFGSGPLGQAVMRELLLRGQRVRLVNRSGKRPGGVPAAVEIMGGNAFDPEFTRLAAQEAAVVFQCAQPEYSLWTTQFSRMQNAILEGAASAQAKFIVGDNLYMYGKVDGPIHEELPWLAHTKKGKARAEAARQVLEAHRSGKVRAAIGRASDFFGPGVLDSACGDRMFLPAVQGKAAQGWGNINLPHTYTFVDDFGRGLVTLGDRDEALGQVWHVPSCETVSTRRFVEIIFEVLCQPPKISVLSRSMMKLGGLFISAARESVEMMYEFESPFVLDDQKFTRAFGGQPTSLHAAIRATVNWYCSHAQVNSRNLVVRQASD